MGGKRTLVGGIDFIILTTVFTNFWSNFIVPAKAALRMKQVRFTGSPAFTDDGTFYVPNPGPVQYVGLPSPEIDEAWHQLTKGRRRSNYTQVLD